VHVILCWCIKSCEACVWSCIKHCQFALRCLCSFIKTLPDLHCRRLIFTFFPKFCTVSQEKEATWCLIITLANVDQFSKFLCQLILKKILCTYYKDFHLCNYTTLWNSKIQCYWIFMWNMTICLTKIYCEILCKLPQKYCIINFSLICVQHVRYSVDRTKTVWR